MTRRLDGLPRGRLRGLPQRCGGVRWHSGTVTALPTPHAPHDPGGQGSGSWVPTIPHVIVIGGGISGLSAAWFLVQSQTPLSVTVLESTSVLGGKLSVSDVAGISVDEGAESFVASRPEALLLARAVGMERDLATPRETGSRVWSRGRARALPRGLFTGIPTDLRALAASEVISMAGLLRIPLDHAMPAAELAEDVSVGDLVGRRLGREVVDRLVEPLLGSVYAGRADTLSMAATMPALYRELRHERSLLAATRRVVSGGMVAAGARRGVPFRGVIGGVGRVPGAMAAALVGAGVQIRTGSTVRSIRPAEFGWHVEIGPAASPEVLRADAIVLATPAGPAARILGGVAPEAAQGLAQIEYASVAVAVLAYRSADVTAPLSGSGLLVPPIEGRAVKAITYLESKWSWVQADAAGRGLHLLRVSVGRHGEAADLERSDSELIDLVRVDLAYLLGIQAAPVDSRITRWSGALPQYAVGHRALVERVRTGLREVPTVAVCGAHLDGVGVAACVGSAHEASSRVLRGLAQLRARS